MMAKNDRNKIAEKVCKWRFSYFGREKFEIAENIIFLVQKWWKNGKVKKFWSKFFSESIQNVSKRILNRKSHT